MQLYSDMKTRTHHWTISTLSNSIQDNEQFITYDDASSLLYTHFTVKLSLCFFFNWAPSHEGALGEWRYRATHSLTSALDGGEWSALRPGRFTPGKDPLVPTG
jgi:hypothetical protein